MSGRTGSRGSRVVAGVFVCIVHGTAHAAAAHVHGKATLDVALEGGVLTLELSTPLDNLVGFEHAPRTAEQQAAVRRMAERLHKGDTLFVPTPEAHCVRAAITLQSPVIAPALLAPPSAAAQPSTAPATTAPATTAASHAELDMTLVFRCAQPQKLASLDVGLFDAFPQLKRIEARVAAGGRQSAAELTARKRRLTW